MSDHIYKKIDIVPKLQNSERVVRPANLAPGAAGRTFTVVQTNSGVPAAVFSLLGRIFMNNMHAGDPFAVADRVLDDLPENVRVCVCDIHAEATSEKVAGNEKQLQERKRNIPTMTAPQCGTRSTSA